MSTRSAVVALPDSPLDVIGDVHGELHALEHLLEKLGYDEHGAHPDGRRLVFVGDLIDRGPDSPGVLRAVMRLIEAGNAQCIIGNHELNALRNDSSKNRSGEGWWYTFDEPGYDSVLVSREEKEQSFLPFLRSLPGALERDDLRVVHACWHAPSIEALRAYGSVIDFYHDQDSSLAPRLSELGDAAGRAVLAAGYGKADFKNAERKMRHLPELAAYDEQNQMGNAAKIVTSGMERAAPDSYYSSGKWRMVERTRWWDDYDDVPVVVGHYWRRYHAAISHDGEKADADLFGDTGAHEWLGRAGCVMCIDYSVGFRFKERVQGGGVGRFDHCLGALRVPEWRLVFDDDRPDLEVGAPGGRD